MKQTRSLSDLSVCPNIPGFTLAGGINLGILANRDDPHVGRVLISALKS